jgi:hypothetical protein
MILIVISGAYRMVHEVRYDINEYYKISEKSKI